MVAFPWVATYFYYQNQGTLKRKWRHYQLGWGQEEQTWTTLRQSRHHFALLWGAVSQ